MKRINSTISHLLPELSREQQVDFVCIVAATIIALREENLLDFAQAICEKAEDAGVDVDKIIRVYSSVTKGKETGK